MDREKMVAGGGSGESGEGGIRTHETLTGLPVFETGSFSHSDTSPGRPL